MAIESGGASLVESLLQPIPVPDTFPWVMQNRFRLEIVDGPLKGKKFEFAEYA